MKYQIELINIKHYGKMGTAPNETVELVFLRKTMALPQKI
jgi:hypothetical protein